MKKRYRYAEPNERESVRRQIDPEKATVFFVYGQVLDPYGDDPDLPEEEWCVGRQYFAVDPRDGVAVVLWDLPETTREALEQKRRDADAEGWRQLL